jgi:autotransporter adhesin
MTVTNSLGNTHGLVVGESSTTLSGGTRSTNLTLNDNGATFSNAASGAPTRVTGVANGAGDFDAVNVRQFSSAVAGVAASANIPGVDTNKTASVGVGLGSYMNSQALAFGGSYRFSDNGVLRASLATGLNTGGSKTSFGVGAGWSW